MIQATATCREQSTGKKKAKQWRIKKKKKGIERKIKSNYCFHTLNKYNAIEALSEFRAECLCWIIKVSLINNFRKWSDLARMMGLLKQTAWLGLSVKCRVTSVSCGVLDEGLWLLIRVIRFRDVWPIYELPQLQLISYTTPYWWRICCCSLCLNTFFRLYVSLINKNLVSKSSLAKKELISFSICGEISRINGNRIKNFLTRGSLKIFSLGMSFP